MTLEEIRAAREQAELEIRQILEQFKADTGLSIIACEVVTIKAWHAEHAKPDMYLSNVNLTVESI